MLGLSRGLPRAGEREDLRFRATPASWCRSAETPRTPQGSGRGCDPSPALLPRTPGLGPHLGTVLGDEEELGEGTVQWQEDARLCHILKQAVLHVDEELPQGL